ncbi:MAG TPA: hypothetical protein VEW46_21140 [Pyrinomonadaceae bacterium]|nr:hypothetical protein [Pyrinomonadaceae bacterium]
MKRKWTILGGAGLGLIVVGASIFSGFNAGAAVSQTDRAVRPFSGFNVEILVNGRPQDEYHARGRRYVEAIEGREYEVRLRNPLPYRVAVALSVDGLNTIDARRTSAWNASKWVIEPYGTISIGGWQTSSQRARRFYFTTERDSYGAKLGQTANLGVISAVFFRERRPIPVPITPAPYPRPRYEEDGRDSSKSRAPSNSTGNESSTLRRGEIAPVPDDDYAATGIGRSVQNDVRWVNMDLDSRPAGEVLIRYEYYPALVRLGIVPRHYSRPDSLRRREGATGFEDRRFSPEL